MPSDALLPGMLIIDNLSVLIVDMARIGFDTIQVQMHLYSINISDTYAAMHTQLRNITARLILHE